MTEAEAAEWKRRAEFAEGAVDRSITEALYNECLREIIAGIGADAGAWDPAAVGRRARSLVAERDSLRRDNKALRERIIALDDRAEKAEVKVGELTIRNAELYESCRLAVEANGEVLPVDGMVIRAHAQTETKDETVTIRFDSEYGFGGKVKVLVEPGSAGGLLGREVLMVMRREPGDTDHVVYVIDDHGVLVGWRTTYAAAMERAREIRPDLAGMVVKAVEFDRAPDGVLEVGR